MLIMIPFHFISGLENEMQALHGGLSGLHLSWRSQLGQRICTVAYTKRVGTGLENRYQINLLDIKKQTLFLTFVPCGDQRDPFAIQKVLINHCK